MAAPNFSLPYPPVLPGNDNLQYVKAVIPAGYATVVNVFTTAQNTLGRFFVTQIVIHDPVVPNATPSTTLAFGSASTSTTAVSSSIFLSGLTGSVANQYVSIVPGQTFGAGFIQGGAQPATTTLTTLVVSTPVLALGPGDVLQCFVLNAANTTTQSYQVDFCGYYL